MTPELLAWMKWASVTVTIPALLRWLAGDHGQNEWDELAEAHKLVLDTLSDADEIGYISTVTDHNLRDQMTVDQAQALYQEAGQAEMKRKGWWN